MTGNVFRAGLIVCIGLLAGCDRFTSPEQHVARAAEQIAQGRQSAAMAELKSAVQKDPQYAPARAALAELNWWFGDLDSAQKEINRAREAGGDTPALQVLRYRVLLERAQGAEVARLLETDTTLAPERRAVFEAQIALLDNDGRAAREALSRGMAAAPSDPEVLYESARLSMMEGITQPALELPEHVQADAAFHARALHLKGVAEMSKGAFPEARQTLNRAHAEAGVLRLPEQLALAVARTETEVALRDASAAQSALNRVASLAPNSVVAHNLAARIAMLNNDFQKAIAESQMALRVEPNHVPSQLLLASAHFSVGSLEQAQDVLTQLLAAKPETVAARKLLAQVYLARNRPDEAQRILGTAGNADADVQWLMGSALMRSGSTAAGIEHLERSVEANPDDYERVLALAGAYISARRPEDAKALLAKIPPQSPAAQRASVLTVLAAASGKPRAEARREIEQLVARNDKDASLTFAAGSLLAGIGEGASARTLLERAVKLDPKHVEARVALARLDAGERMVQDAQRRLDEVISIEPRQEGARLFLSELAWMQGDRSGARTYLEQAIAAEPAAIDARLRLAQIAFIEGDGARARGVLDQVMQIAPDRKVALRQVGRVFARAGFVEEALTRFKEAQAAGDREATLDAARAQFDLNDLQAARATVQAALSADPSWREAQQLLVTIDARDGQVDRAFERAKGLLTDPSPVSLALLKGDLQAMAGKTAEAIGSYESAQRLQPSAPVAVRLYQLRRQIGESSPERSLTQWLERTPGDLEVRRMLALYYEAAGQGERAIGEYERLAGAGDVVALNNLAWALHSKGDPRALDLARKAHESAPKHPEIADTYGWILVRMGKVSEGLAVLQSALVNAPNNPDILYHVAAAYRQSGDADRAAQLVKQALEPKRDFVSRAEAEQLARELADRKGAR